MSHGIEDIYSVYDITTPRARKEHRCGACGQAISIGHIYARVYILFDGEKETVRRCLGGGR